jgi:hypothetical protein
MMDIHMSGCRWGVLTNNALQRNAIHRGHPVLAIDCVLAGVESASWPSAELGR